MRGAAAVARPWSDIVATAEKNDKTQAQKAGLQAAAVAKRDALEKGGYELSVTLPSDAAMQPHHKWLVSQQDSDEIGLKLEAMDCRLVSFTLPGAPKRGDLRPQLRHCGAGTPQCCRQRGGHREPIRARFAAAILGEALCETRA